MEYLPTQNNYSDFQPQEIQGYKKQFSFFIPRGDKQKTTPTQETTPEPTTIEDIGPAQGYSYSTPKVLQETVVQQTPTFSDREIEVLLKDGTAEEKRKVANKYLQQNLGLTKEQAAALVGVWQAESGFNLNAENKAEKSGKSKHVKSTEYGIGIGQWTGNRHNAYVAYLSSHGGQNNLKTQLDFAISEIQNKYSDYLNNLRSAGNVKDATAYTYAQYVAANHRNIKGLDDLYDKVDKISKRYKNVNNNSSGSGFDRRVKYANENVFAKLGGKLLIYKV